MELLTGEVKFGDVSIHVMSSHSYDDASLSRDHLLALHTLRWADVLRRVDGTVEGARTTWERVVDAWADSDVARDAESFAWSLVPLEQRSIALALGADTAGRFTPLLRRHTGALRAVEATQPRALTRLRLLDARLGLMVASGEDDEELRRAAVEATAAVFSEDGYAVAEDLAEMAQVVPLWRERLDLLGVDGREHVLHRLNSHDCWLHLTSPDGRLVPMGGALPDHLPGAEEPTMRYILTGGGEGSSPGVVRSVNDNGYISLRSGWGETELDARDETHTTCILGPVRSRTAHHDVGRVTFNSQGRPWLIDPPDAQVTSAEGHSVVSVANRHYRLHGSAELTRRYGDERVEGFVIGLSVHAMVRWQRHVVFARTKNYMVIEDAVRSSDTYVAAQNWVVAPDVEIEEKPQGFWLHADGKTVALHITTPQLRESAVEEMCDAQGERVAWRISVPMVGTSTRSVAIISDVVDHVCFEARRRPHPGREFSVDIRDTQLDETLVVTPELSTIVPPGLSPDEAVRRAVAQSTAGALSEGEQAMHRRMVRSAIHEVKREIMADGGTRAARERGLLELQHVASDLGLAGLRDHGYGAALIDIAGTDLRELVDHVPQVMNSRRSALVQWCGQDLQQPLYEVPVRTTHDARTPPELTDGPMVWSVDLGQLVPAALLMDGPGDVLTVYFHGATDRGRFRTPRFERLRSFAALGLGPVMFMSDPCLDLDSRMVLSWYVGTEEVDLAEVTGLMIQTYAAQRGLDKVLLVGNSGGGFAALQQGAYLEGAKVVCFNPQIIIDDYVPRMSEAAHWALFGRTTVSDDPAHAHRMDLVKSYQRIGFEQDVFLIQNLGDDHHVQHHMRPFCEAFEKSPASRRLSTQTPYLGPGHRVPDPSEYLEYVRLGAAAPSSSWSLRGLRAR
ncbi:heparinase II/III family protein [uncultured Serinicoccus sp.]|uniref:heparinase II/III family protein n=1 Tax=uncultured Serinicoccus sp. TaxID=735514 RepID=UPI002616AA09|nr:heparinase II/III family protein [uncultured Serinicoccus sp.]